MISAVRGRVQDMRENVQGALEKATSDTVNSAKKMADDVSLGIQKGVDQTTAAFDNINSQVTQLGQTFNTYRTKLVTDKNTLAKIKEVMEKESANVATNIDDAKAVAIAEIE